MESPNQPTWWGFLFGFELKLGVDIYDLTMSEASRDWVGQTVCGNSTMIWDMYTYIFIYIYRLYNQQYCGFLQQGWPPEDWFQDAVGCLQCLLEDDLFREFHWVIPCFSTVRVYRYFFFPHCWGYPQIIYFGKNNKHPFGTTNCEPPPICHGF